MSKLTLSKTIEAKKLNPKTGVGLPGTETAIPYGAILENLERHGDSARFRYQTELYGCRYQVVEEAIDVGASGESEPGPGGSAAAPAAAGKPRLQWEQVASSGPATHRAKVPGGWLVAVSSGVTFLPDHLHTWDGTSERSN